MIHSCREPSRIQIANKVIRRHCGKVISSVASQNEGPSKGTCMFSHQPGKSGSFGANSPVSAHAEKSVETVHRSEAEYSSSQVHRLMDGVSAY